MDEIKETVPSPLSAEAAEAPPHVTPTASEPATPRGSRSWTGIALFLLGVVAGVLGFVIVARLMTTPTPTVDAVAMREAARAGTLDAIATLQAGGPAAAESAATPTPAVVDVSRFNLRAANRIGSPDAPVTIIEFSDFQ